MKHCWTDRYEASGAVNLSLLEMEEMDRRWTAETIPMDAWEIVSTYLGETCMLRAGHKGPHEFQTTDTIVLKFGDSLEVAQ